MITIKSHVKAGKITTNHNQATKGLRVKSRVKAGFNFVAVVSKSSSTGNHNQAVKGLRVKSRVKAGIRLSDILVSGYC